MLNARHGLCVLLPALLSVGLVACEYVEAGNGEVGSSEIPPVRAIISQAEALYMGPGRYATRLYRGKRNAIEERYERRMENADGNRLDRLENAMERELSDLEYNYEDLCLALERRDYTCDTSDDGN